VKLSSQEKKKKQKTTLTDGICVLSQTEKFASLITGSPSATSDLFESGSIETLSPDAFDPKGQYTAVFRAVRTAAVASDASSNVDESGIDVKVYRVEVGKSRVEYWVLALDVAEGRIVGLRAKAVET
jgi:hypothetical protein